MRRGRQLTIKARRSIAGTLFILPFIIGFVFFMAWPLIDSFYMSLCDVKLSASGKEPVYIGLYNYIKAFTIDPEFNRMLVEELGRMSSHSVATLVVAFVIALVLNQRFKGRALVRAIFFLPVILASGVLVGFESSNTLLSGIRDMVNQSASTLDISNEMRTILRLTGIGGHAFDIVFTLLDSVYDIVIASGIQIVVFLSGLQTISPTLYEAADVEGCTKWESFWEITFPIVSPLLVVNIIYTIIDFFMKSDNQIMEKITEEMVINLNYGFSSAMSWIYFAMTIALVGISSLIISRGVQTYE